MIRPARVADLPVLQEIEVAAGAPFRDLGMDMIADDDPPTLEDFCAFQETGRAWIFADSQDRPVAYLLVESVDGYAHIEQVSVHPEYARRGLGRRLLEAVEEWARGQELSGLTLTTYANVPWNAPYYERLGFRTLVDADLTDGLRAIRQHEADRGLDAWPRVTMLRPLP